MSTPDRPYVDKQGGSYRRDKPDTEARLVERTAETAPPAPAPAPQPEAPKKPSTKRSD